MITLITAALIGCAPADSIDIDTGIPAIPQHRETNVKIYANYYHVYGLVTPGEFTEVSATSRRPRTQEELKSGDYTASLEGSLSTEGAVFDEYCFYIPLIDGNPASTDKPTMWELELDITNAYGVVSSHQYRSRPADTLYYPGWIVEVAHPTDLGDCWQELQ